MHRGHIHLSPEMSHYGVNQLNADLISMIQKCTDAGISTTNQSQLVYIETGQVIGRNELRYTVEKQKPYLSESIIKETSAEEILRTLKAMPKLSVFALYGTSSSSLLTPKTATKKKAKILKYSFTKSGSNEETAVEDLEDNPLVNDDDSYVRLVKALSVGNSNSKILLAVGWVHDDDLKVLARFPSVLKIGYYYQN